MFLIRLLSLVIWRSARISVFPCSCVLSLLSATSVLSRVSLPILPRASWVKDFLAFRSCIGSNSCSDIVSALNSSKKQKNDNDMKNTSWPGQYIVSVPCHDWQTVCSVNEQFWLSKRKRSRIVTIYKIFAGGFSVRWKGEGVSFSPLRIYHLLVICSKALIAEHVKYPLLRLRLKPVPTFLAGKTRITCAHSY